MQSDTDDGTASGKRSTVRLVIEAVGNFVLVFAFGVAIATHSWFAPLFIGAPLVAMVYTRNRVPDAYYNPSLTFAMLMRRRVAIRDALAFWLIQSGSGLSAAMLVCALVGPRHLAVTAATVNGSTLGAAFALELVFTFALGFVAFDVSRSNSRTPPMAATVGRSLSPFWRAPSRLAPPPRVPSIPESASTTLCLESSRGRRYGSTLCPSCSRESPPRPHS